MLNHFTLLLFIALSIVSFSQEAESDFVLRSVIEQLKIPEEEILIEKFTFKQLPYSPSEMVVAIPRFEYKEYENGGHRYNIDAYIVIFNQQTGKITHTFVEENAWYSDDVTAFTGISIDTAPYYLKDSIRGFGIRATYNGSGRFNRLIETYFSLFIPEGNTLKKVVKNLKVHSHTGETDGECTARFNYVNAMIQIDQNTTNGWNNLRIKNEYRLAISIPENEKCQEHELLSTDDYLLKYDGKEYKEETAEISAVDFLHNKTTLLVHVLQKLNLRLEGVNLEFYTEKQLPYDKNLTAMLIPMYIGFEDADFDSYHFNCDLYIIVVNHTTGEIIHYDLQKNTIESDAVRFSKLTIDTAPYYVTGKVRAFGVRIGHEGSSKPNPYSLETLSLFIPDKERLQCVLEKFPVYERRGEWDTRCNGEFEEKETVLIMEKERSNGFFDIKVKQTVSLTTTAVVGEDCQEEVVRKTNSRRLKHNSSVYQ